MSILRRSVRGDIEALLNSRRRWRSWQAAFRELSVSPLNYGIPDCTGARFHDTNERDALRREIEDTLQTPDMLRWVVLLERDSVANNS